MKENQERAPDWQGQICHHDEEVQHTAMLWPITWGKLAPQYCVCRLSKATISSDLYCIPAQAPFFEILRHVTKYRGALVLASFLHQRLEHLLRRIPAKTPSSPVVYYPALFVVSGYTTPTIISQPH